MMSKLTFGYKKPTEQYVLRPSCYAVIFNDTCSKMAVIKKEIVTFYLVAVWKVKKPKKNVYIVNCSRN